VHGGSAGLRALSGLRVRRAVAVAGVLAVLAGCGVERPPEVGRRAPAFEAVSLEGEPVALAAYRGEVVLLNVWATWCYPCIREMPSLQALQEEMGAAGLRVVGVSIDAPGSTEAIREFVDELGLGITILHDPAQRVARTFHTRGVPETFLIGRDGTLLRHWIGRIDGKSEGVRGPVREELGEG
jgi:cytochrome c biogenesis protein CcmG, thiol:disulfide interchange protein DsbE